MHAFDRTLINRLGFADPDKQVPQHDLACQYLADPETAARLLQAIVAPKLASIAPKPFDFPNDTIPKRGSHVVDLGSLAVARTSTEFPISKGEGSYKTTIGFADVVIVYGYDVAERGKCRRTSDRVIETTGWYYDEFQLVSEDETYVFPEVPENSPARGLVARYLDMGVRFRSESGRLYFSALDPESIGPKFHEELRNYRSEIKSLLKCDPVYRKKGDTVSCPVWKPFSVPHPHQGALAIEVKVTPVPIGDFLRQINLYRGFPLLGDPNAGLLASERHHNPRPAIDVTWLAVTDYPISALDLESLRREGIHHARLGSKFDQWIQEHQAAAATAETADGLII